jgi:hypothetical protein
MSGADVTNNDSQRLPQYARIFFYSGYVFLDASFALFSGLNRTLGPERYTPTFDEVAFAQGGCSYSVSLFSLPACSEA